MRLALGTVQFGLKYGVANNTGRVTEKTVSEILNLAEHLGVDVLDTAAAYGNSEQVLGRNNLRRFSVISKTPTNMDNFNSEKSWVEDCVNQSLDNLGIHSLGGILLHRPLDLLKPSGKALYKELHRVKKEGLVKKIGVSIYSPEDLENLAGFDFDIVQGPMNIIDRRLKHSGWLDRLRDKGVEIHIRSAFLQGLLVMPKTDRPDYFYPWSSLLAEYDAWLERDGLTPIQACLGYLNSQPEVDTVVVGVDNPDQLKEIVDAMQTPDIKVPNSIHSSDLNLVNPARWSL